LPSPIIGVRNERKRKDEKVEREKRGEATPSL
jgi:hypothetical protein